MRFISVLFVSSALFLASWAAPVARAPGTVVNARESPDSRTPGGDIFSELDLTAREDTGLELRLEEPPEAPGDRGPESGGCVVA
ncbi:hypothetical protein C8R44DRAFT_893677 [Mycena epipterygia]|nr:hypothetical protein C8R44DRAFT_893677 [Mycena epipterygia]